MFCRNCGHKIGNEKKFCTQCGTEILSNNAVVNTLPMRNKELWWHRLVKVVYIVLHVPLPFLLIGVWTESSSSFDYISKTYGNTYGEAFFNTLVALIIYAVILRAFKIAYQYIVLGKVPVFKEEIKRFY